MKKLYILLIGIFVVYLLNAEIIYIPDDHETIQAGIDAGWKSIIYESPDSLDKAYAMLQG